MTNDEIRDARDGAIKVIDALLIAGHSKLSAAEKTDLRKTRNKIEDAALDDLLASDELAQARGQPWHGRKQ